MSGVAPDVLLLLPTAPPREHPQHERLHAINTDGLKVAAEVTTGRDQRTHREFLLRLAPELARRLISLDETVEHSAP
jgi:hypothetical protein